MGCPPVRGLSYVQVDTHGIITLYHLQFTSVLTLPITRYFVLKLVSVVYPQEINHEITFPPKLRFSTIKTQWTKFLYHQYPLYDWFARVDIQLHFIIAFKNELKK